LRLFTSNKIYLPHVKKGEKTFPNQKNITLECLTETHCLLYGFLKEENIIKCRFRATPPPSPGTLLLFRCYLLFPSDSAQIEKGGGLRSTMLYDAIYEKTFAYLFFLSLTLSLFRLRVRVSVCVRVVVWVSVCE